MPWKTGMIPGVGYAPRPAPYFACDVCGAIRFEKNARIAPTWQRCKKCGTEYVAPKTWSGKQAWKRKR
jgi:hypothetical protein